MTHYTVRRTINAPKERVFATVSDISDYTKAIPDIVRVEFLSETKRGVGTRFRETRLMRGKEATVELEVTEFVANERVRLVSDAGGTIWDSVFTVESVDGQTELALTMDAKPYKLLAKLFTPLMKRMLTNALARDMDAVKAYCEQ